MNKLVRIFDCSCHTHHLRVEAEFDDDVDGVFYLSMLEGMGARLRLWTRLRIAMNMFFTGKEFYDSIIINKESAKELSEFIIENSKDK